MTEWLLGAGWHVVVPWVHERELERVTAHDHLELMRADLFDPGAVSEIVTRAAADPQALLGAVVNLVGGFDARDAFTRSRLNASRSSFGSTCAPPTWSPRRHWVR
ncbi:MAG: hypothetical protein ABI355_10925 [Solirubrobacteraceae bacterium]